MSFIGGYIGAKRGVAKGNAYTKDYYEVEPEGRPALTGMIGVLGWLLLALTWLVLAKDWIVPLFIITLGWRRVYVTYVEDREDLHTHQPRNLAPKVVKPTVRLALFDSSTGPTVSVIWSTGEIVTNSFPTWREANACAENLQTDFETDGVSVTVEIL